MRITDCLRKGNKLETLIDIQLSILQSKLKFRYLKDVKLSSESDRGFTQIDFIVLTNFQYLCIEVKNWECKVECTPNAYWKVEYDRPIFTLSPIQQNLNHIRKLNRVSTNRWRCIVCFSDNTQIINKLDDVLTVSELLSYIETIANKKEIVHTDAEIDEDYMKIRDCSIYTHLKFLKKEGLI